MSEFEYKQAGQAGGGGSDLQEEVNSLRLMLSASLVLLIIFSLCVDVALLKQVSALRTQVDVNERVAGEFNSSKAIEFWNRLVQYSRTHPDYAPIISKYSPALSQTLLGNPGTKP